MRLIAIRTYDEACPKTGQTFECKDYMYRRPEGGYLLRFMGGRPDCEPADDHDYDLSDLFEWYSIMPMTIKRGSD